MVASDCQWMRSHFPGLWGFNRNWGMSDQIRLALPLADIFEASPTRYLRENWDEDTGYTNLWAWEWREGNRTIARCVDGGYIIDRHTPTGKMTAPTEKQAYMAIDTQLERYYTSERSSKS